MNRLVLIGTAGVMLFVGAGGWWYTQQFALPHPSESTREELLRWLVLRDLSEEPFDVQVALLDRLQEEMNAGMAVDTDRTETLSERHREQLAANAEFLKDVWFQVRVREYQDVPLNQRIAFLSDQIQAVVRWQEIDAAAETEAESSGESKPVFGEIDEWIDNSPDHLQPLARRAVSDGVVVWLATRSLEEVDLEVRTALARRIVASLRRGSTNPGDLGLPLNASHEEQLTANGKLLLEVYLHDVSREFADVPAQERLAFVDTLIDDFFDWGVPDVLSNGESPSSLLQRARQWNRLQSELQLWVDRAPGDVQEPFQQLLALTQQRLLWRSLRGSLPGSED